jgi:hypothetical protein
VGTQNSLLFESAPRFNDGLLLMMIGLHFLTATQGANGF